VTPETEHDLWVDAHNRLYMQIISDYMALGMSLDNAQEDLNLREGENGNGNGC
jgi:hypothetical protein